MNNVKQSPFAYAVVAWFAVLLAVILWARPTENDQKQSEPVVVEPEVVVVYAEPEVETPPPAFYSDFSEITDEERGLLAMVVYRESRGQERDGQKAVAEVILNRVRNPEFPNTINDVVYQEGQFACAYALKNKSIKELGCLSYAFDVVDEVLVEETTVVPDRYLYFSTKAPGHNDYMKIGDHYFW